MTDGTADGNLFAALPAALDREVFEDLLSADGVRIERIVSRGQSSPASGWYDQDEHEWVLVLEGFGTVAFEDGREVTLAAGDYLHIPARTRHRVVRTDPARRTVWLTVFYG